MAERQTAVEEFFASLVNKPWWLSVCFGIAFFLGVRYVVPLLPLSLGIFGGIVDTLCGLFS